MNCRITSYIFFKQNADWKHAHIDKIFCIATINPILQFGDAKNQHSSQSSGDLDVTQGTEATQTMNCL